MDEAGLGKADLDLLKKCVKARGTFVQGVSKSLCQKGILQQKWEQEKVLGGIIYYDECKATEKAEAFLREYKKTRRSKRWNTVLNNLQWIIPALIALAELIRSICSN